MKHAILFTCTLALVLQATVVQAAIELRTVTKQTQADQWLEFSISMKPHPNGSGATLVAFTIPGEQTKQHKIHDASVFFKEGKEVPFHAPLWLKTNEDGSVSADVTLAKPLLVKAWIGVHVYRNRGSGSGTQFSIDLGSYAETDDTTVEANLESLQGSWRPISAEYKGKALDSDDYRTLKFTGDKVAQLRKGKVHVEGSVQMAKPGQSSKRAYWKYTNVNVTDAVTFFFVGRDTLITCWTGEQRTVPEWPTEFSTRSPGGCTFCESTAFMRRVGPGI